MKMGFTGERIIGKQRAADKRFADHLVRYNFAKDYTKGLSVLDIACGMGYGSDMLADVAKNVIGVDVDSQVITNAQGQYKKANLTYICGDGKTIPCDDASIDVVVSFETIEHIVDYMGFLNEIKRVLKPGGKLIMSTPNYLGEIVKNKYHVSNFTTQQFHDAVAEVFMIEKKLYQGKHFYPIPGRGIIETLLGIQKDVDIREELPEFDHHVSILIAQRD